MSAWIVSHGHIDAIVNFYLYRYGRARGNRFAGAQFEPLEMKRYRRLPYADGREADPYLGRVIFEDLREEKNRQRLGEILLNENWKSIWHRYPDTQENMNNAPGHIQEIEDNSDSTMDLGDETNTNIGGYRYKDCQYNDCISLGQFFKALHCLDYQSCEHPEWEDSDAKYIIDRMMQDVTTTMILEEGLVRGYKDAKWGL